ncbi:MAG: response regulator transcription factor [Hydrogenophaga sp.]|nr:response regulator transcription factor [Hydrogenophaga sp.]
MQPTSVTSGPIRVQVVAQPIVAWGLERLIESAHPRLCVAGSSEYIKDCLEQLQKNPADVALVDLDNEAGEEAVSQLFAMTHMHILAIGSTHKTAQQDSAVLAGARGVIEKRESPALLLKALEKVHEGELWVGRVATSRIFSELARQKTAKVPSPEAGRIASLTPRERQAIAALASDATAPGKVIAARLHISEHTLRNHLTVIYSKLGVPNRLALYAYARQHGLTDPD